MVETIRSVATGNLSAASAQGVAELKNRGTQSIDGNVQLSGFGWISSPAPGYASINFNGYVRVQGDGGHLTGGGNFNFSHMVFLSGGNYVTANVPLTISVQIEKDGKPIGTGTVTGNILVSGFCQQNSVNLNGSGPVWGNVNVPDAAPSQLPRMNSAQATSVN